MNIITIRKDDIQDTCSITHRRNYINSTEVFPKNVKMRVVCAKLYHK